MEQAEEKLWMNMRKKKTLRQENKGEERWVLPSQRG